MICLFWEWGILGTLSLDFHVLAKDEIVWGTRYLGSGQALALATATALWPVCTFMPESGKHGKHDTAWRREP